MRSRGQGLPPCHQAIACAARAGAAAPHLHLRVLARHLLAAIVRALFDCGEERNPCRYSKWVVGMRVGFLVT